MFEAQGKEGLLFLCGGVFWAWIFTCVKGTRTKLTPVSVIIYFVAY